MRKSVTTVLGALLMVGAAGAQTPATLPGLAIGQPVPHTNALQPVVPAQVLAPPDVPPQVLPPPSAVTPTPAPVIPQPAPVIPQPPPVVLPPASVVAPTPTVVPPKTPSAPAPAPVVPSHPPPGFAVGGGLPGGVVVSPMCVRPPEPVAGAATEIPPGPLFWVDFEYLLWRAKGGLVPPLVVGVAGPAAVAVPVNPRDAVPLSDDHMNGNLYSGIRLGAGMWLDKPHGTGVEAIYTRFFQSTDVSSFSSGPDSVLARLFVDANRGGPALFQLSTPTGTTTGMATVRSSFDAEGFEANMLRRGPAMIGEEMYWIVGLRYWGMDETLTAEGASQTGGLRAGAFDTFATRNNFYGAQFGGKWTWTRGDFTVDLTMKMAIGGMGQEAVIQGGSSVIMPGGNRIDRPGGLLALGSNIGDYDRTKLVVMRDTSISIGYCVLPNVRVRLGYDFFWVSNVLRPGEQVDLVVNPRLLPFNPAAPSGPLRPAFKYNGDIFYMHGINLGVVVEF